MVAAPCGVGGAIANGAIVRPKNSSQAPPLRAATTAILLGGWCADPPPTVTDDPHHVEHEFLTLYDSGGIERLWREHESWLREQARLWNWQPTYTLDGVAMFFGEYVANGGPETWNPHVEQRH
jgi:hypothetical protein